jgi:NAD+ kinase
LSADAPRSTGDSQEDLSSHGIALLASNREVSQAAESLLMERYCFAPLDQAKTLVALGGDGFMLETMHRMIDSDLLRPVYGFNLGTVGFLMNRYQKNCRVFDRVAKARPIAVSPLRMEATTQAGETQSFYAINEVSLLRETRQTAKIEIAVNERVRIAELAGDGVLLATPVGSTAYNYSAGGSILPLDSQTLALTPLSPFRPRRWRGAILPDRSRVTFRVLEPGKRPVAAVADQKELRDVAEVRIEIDRNRELTLLFDPGHALDDRIVAEQFAY